MCPAGRAGAGTAHFSCTAHVLCRLLLWAVAGTMGCSAGSAAHWALAQALALAQAQALALALAAGCLGSEEEHWSGDAGFSREGRRRKEFFPTATPQRLLPMSSQPQVSSKGQTSAISGSTILMTTWACSSAYASCGFWSSMFLASWGLFWTHS